MRKLISGHPYDSTIRALGNLLTSKFHDSNTTFDHFLLHFIVNMIITNQKSTLCLCIKYGIAERLIGFIGINLYKYPRWR